MTTSKGALRGVPTTLALLCLSVPAWADEADQPVPRYRLQVGQELKYQGSSEFQYQGGTHGYKTDWQVWVARQNDDGSWRLVVRSSQKFSQSFGGRQPSEGPPRVTLAYCDLSPDGRIVPNESLGFHLDPTPILPRLPANSDHARNGWEGVGVQDDSRTEYKPAAEATSDSETWVFEGIRQSPMDKIYLSTSRSKFFFDRKRGVIKRVESENTQGYGFNGKGTGTTELVALEQHDADWAKTFAEESERYFAANKAYEGLLTRASKDAQQVDALLSRAESTLKDARETLSLPVLREQVDEQLKNQSRMASYYSQEAKDRAAVLGHDAAEWEIKDLEGKTHALKDYRGKVVILDFWYRGCGWCIRAMPQVKELADDFRGQPVAVLGMNTDRDEKDAQFVVEEMKLNYPVMKAEGLPQVSCEWFPDADHHRPGGQGRRRPRRLLADPP